MGGNSSKEVVEKIIDLSEMKILIVGRWDFQDPGEKKQFTHLEFNEDGTGSQILINIKNKHGLNDILQYNWTLSQESGVTFIKFDVTEATEAYSGSVGNGNKAGFTFQRVRTRNEDAVLSEPFLRFHGGWWPGWWHKDEKCIGGGYIAPTLVPEQKKSTAVKLS